LFGRRKGVPICVPSTAKPHWRFSTASTRYLASRTGDVKKLKSPLSGFRLRCGDYRVFFDHTDENTVAITAVRHRREAYR
jgi:mRNA-degrading endonuclease RelE of RelBE toxin-antitoxin system